MLDAAIYRTHVEAAGRALADAAEGHLAEPVPSCPEFTVETLVKHAATFCQWVAAILDEGGLAVAPNEGGDGETIHLHPTDTDGELLITCRGDSWDVTNEHAKGSVAARGPAEDLYLFVWGRAPMSKLEVFGDGSILDRWTTQVQI